jgi:hypothetical protein
MKTVFKRFMSAACLVTLAAHSPLFAEESAPVIYRLSKSASTVMGGALTNAVYWLDESGVLCAASETLDSNADYIVGLKYPDENGDTYCKNIRTGEQDIVFAGKSLTIGDDTWRYGDGVFYFSRYKGAVRFLNEGLFLIRPDGIAQAQQCGIQCIWQGYYSCRRDGKRKFLYNPEWHLD